MRIKNILYPLIFFSILFLCSACNVNGGGGGSSTETSYLLTRYLENYNASYQPLEGWWYDSGNKLETRMVYNYNSSGQNIETILYNINNIIVGRYKYTFSAGKITRGERYETINSVETLVESYDAVYDGNGDNTSLIVYDQSGLQAKKRIVTFISKGYYDTESFYDSSNNLYETYKCYYNSSNQFIKEEHWVKLASDYSSDTTNSTIEQNFTYKYYWNNSGYRYLQEDYDTSSGSEVLSEMFLFQYSGKTKEYRRHFYQGKLQDVISYSNYNEEMGDFESEKRYITLSSPDFLQFKYDRKVWTEGSRFFYEEAIYYYGAPPASSSSPKSAVPSRSNSNVDVIKTKFNMPQEIHYH